MNKAIFFDLDGTLWDALIPLTDSWNEAMKSNGYPYRFTIDSMKSFMGLTPEETCPLAFNGTTLEEGMKLFKICLDAEIKYLALHPGKLYPKEEAILSKLAKDYPLYIVSNCDKGYIENYLNSLNMNKYFRGHLCIGDTGFPKWKNIKVLQEREKIDQVIYLGDTYKDMVESNKADVIFVHAKYGFGPISEDVNFINSLQELPNLVGRLFK